MFETVRVRSPFLLALAAALITLAILLPRAAAPAVAQGPQPGLTISPDSYHQTISQGMIAEISFRLNTEPTAHVTVTPSSPSANVRAVGPRDGKVYFHTDRWTASGNVQVFTQPGAADDAGAGNITLTVTSADPDYNGLSYMVPVTIVGTNRWCDVARAPKVTLRESAGSPTGHSLWIIPKDAWCAGDPVVGYWIAYQQDDGPWQVKRNTIGANPWQWTYSVNPSDNWLNAAPGSTYRVKAMGVTYDRGSSPWSRVTTTQVPDGSDAPALPGPVAGLTLTAEGNGVRVSWRAPELGGEPTRYVVRLEPENGGKRRTRTPKAKKAGVTFDNLESGATYRVWVRAKNETGKGDRVTALITLP